MKHVALCLALLTGAVHAEETKSRTGTAYDLETDGLLYTQNHNERYVDGRIVHDEVIYRDPAGRIFASKKVNFRHNSIMPDFLLLNSATGHEEGASRKGEVIEVTFRANTDEPPETFLLEPPTLGIIDAGFDNFILQYWDRLSSGEIVTLPFLVPSRGQFVNFRIRQADVNGGQANFIIDASSMLLRFLLPKIYLTYDIEERRLRRYEGISNLRDSAAENLNVRIEYP